MFPDVLDVVVTKEHIESGNRRSDSKMGPCPIELALSDVFGSSVNVAVGWITAIAWTGGEAAYYPLSEPAKAFVNAFDSDKPVQPQTFQLRKDR